MHIDIYAHKFSLSSTLKKHTEQQLTTALACCEHQIQRVVIRLSDTNGPRGGKDKRCLLVIRLIGLPEIVVEDTETDLYIAIDRAVERASQTAIRKIQRKKALKKMTYFTLNKKRVA